MWILQPIRQAKSQIRKVLEALTYDSVNGVILDPSGVAIDGAPPSFTWATKPALGATGYVNTVVLITNLHSRGSTGGSLWMNTIGGYVLVSAPVNITLSQLSSASWFGTAGGAIDNTSWPGLRLHITDYFLGGADIYHDGTRWRLATGRAVLSNPAESSLSSVAINQTNYVMASAAWPIGLFLDGDRLEAHVTGQKSGIVDGITLKLGYSTSATVFDAASTIVSTTLTGTADTVSSVFSIARISSTSLKLKGINSFNSQGGTSATNLADAVTTSNLSTVQGYLLFAATTVANETFLPTTFLVELHTCGV